jgi:hypothetical protein
VAFNDEEFSLTKPQFNLKEIMSRELFHKVQDLNKQMKILGPQPRIIDGTGPEHPENFAGQQDRQSPSVASPRNYDHSHLSLFS